MSDTETTCLDYMEDIRLRGREDWQIEQYFRELGISEEMIKGASKSISALEKLEELVNGGMKI